MRRTFVRAVGSNTSLVIGSLLSFVAIVWVAGKHSQTVYDASKYR